MKAPFVDSRVVSLLTSSVSFLPRPSAVAVSVQNSTCQVVVHRTRNMSGRHRAPLASPPTPRQDTLLVDVGLVRDPNATRMDEPVYFK